MPESNGCSRSPRPALKASSGIVPAVEAQLPAPVTLPSNLSGSLKYLDDAQLHRLQDAAGESKSCSSVFQGGAKARSHRPKFSNTPVLGEPHSEWGAEAEEVALTA